VSNYGDEGIERCGVSPDQQCTLPSCERAAVDPTRPGTLCDRHLDAVRSCDEVGEESGTDGTGSSNSSRDHENPTDVADVTEFDHVPRLIPLEEEGKAPIIRGRCTLDSPEGREYLVDDEEAIRQIREEGARRFAIYAGKGDHRTAALILVDVDDRETFPYDAFSDTLLSQLQSVPR